MDNFFIIMTVWQLLHIFWLCLYLMSKMITLDAYVLEMWNFAHCIWRSDQINVQRDRRGHIYINFITHNSIEFMDFNNFWWRVWDFILNMNSLSSEIIATVIFSLDLDFCYCLTYLLCVEHLQYYYIKAITFVIFFLYVLEFDIKYRLFRHVIVIFLCMGHLTQNVF